MVGSVLTGYKIFSTGILANGSVAGTYDYTVPADSFLVLQAYVYRHVGGGTGIIRAYIPAPNDTFDITASLAATAALVYTDGSRYTIPEGCRLRLVTTGTSTLTAYYLLYTKV